MSAPVDLRALYESYWNELCGYLRHRFGLGPPEPEDIVQAAFANFAAVASQGKIANPRAFLYATARHLVFDHHRHQRYCDGHARDVQHTAEHEILSEISPERVLLDRERVRLLSEALKRLSPKQRRMVLLSRFEGLSHTEIAARFGVSAASVQKQVERGLAECHRYMNAVSKPRAKK